MIEIRQAGHDDTAACQALASELIEGKPVPWPWEPYAVTYVAYSAETLIGVAVLMIQEKIRGRLAAHVADIIVHQAWRKQGVGRALLERCKKGACLNDCYKMTVSCSAEVAPFYEACGFEQHELTLRMDLTEAGDGDPAPES